MDKKKLMRDNVACILSKRPADEPQEMGQETDNFAAIENVEKEDNASAPARLRKDSDAAVFGVGHPRKERGPLPAGKLINYTTSFVFDFHQYIEVEKIADRERLSKKAAMRKIIELGLESYREARKR